RLRDLFAVGSECASPTVRHHGRHATKRGVVRRGYRRGYFGFAASADYSPYWVLKSGASSGWIKLRRIGVPRGRNTVGNALDGGAPGVDRGPPPTAVGVRADGG